jgi:hypothetical protein
MEPQIENRSAKSIAYLLEFTSAKSKEAKGRWQIQQNGQKWTFLSAAGRLTGIIHP